MSRISSSIGRFSGDYAWPVLGDYRGRVAEIHAQSILALDRADRQPVSVPESEPADELVD